MEALIDKHLSNDKNPEAQEVFALLAQALELLKTSIAVKKNASACLVKKLVLSEPLKQRLTIWIESHRSQWTAKETTYWQLFRDFPENGLVADKAYVKLLDTAVASHHSVARWILAARDPIISRGQIVRRAAGMGKVAALHILTTSGMDLELMRHNNCVSIDTAASKNQLGVLQWFKERGLDKNDMLHALYSAASNGYVNILRFLKDDCGATIEDVRRQQSVYPALNHSVIVSAAVFGHVGVLQFFKNWTDKNPDGTESSLTVEDALCWTNSMAILSIIEADIGVLEFFEAWGRFQREPLEINLNLVQAFEKCARWIGCEKFLKVCQWVLRVTKTQNAGLHCRQTNWSQLFDLALAHDCPHTVSFLMAHGRDYMMPWVTDLAQRHADFKKHEHFFSNYGPVARNNVSDWIDDFDKAAACGHSSVCRLILASAQLKNYKSVGNWVYKLLIQKPYMDQDSSALQLLRMIVDNQDQDPEKETENGNLVKFLYLAAAGGRLFTLHHLKNEHGLTKDMFCSRDNLALRLTCEMGHVCTLQMFIKWSWPSLTVGEEKQRLTMQDARAKNNYAFRKACQHGHLATAVSLRQAFYLTKEDASAKENYALRYAVRNGQKKIVSYLETHPFFFNTDDVRVKNNYALRHVLREAAGPWATKDHLKVARMLMSHPWGLDSKDLRAKDNYVLRHVSAANNADVYNFVAAQLLNLPYYQNY